LRVQESEKPGNSHEVAPECHFVLGGSGGPSPARKGVDERRAVLKVISVEFVRNGTLTSGGLVQLVDRPGLFLHDLDVDVYRPGRKPDLNLDGFDAGGGRAGFDTPIVTIVSNRGNPRGEPTRLVGLADFGGSAL
jgi:hypothetical protein